MLERSWPKIRLTEKGHQNCICLDLVISSTYSFDACAERRPRGVRYLQIRHTETRLLLKKVFCKRLWRNSSSNFVPDFVHEFGVKLNVFLSLS